MKTFACVIILLLAASALVPLTHALPQSQEVVTVIDAENIQRLQSVTTLDFADLPEGVVSASGLFAISADAQKVVTFGSLPNQPPLSQAILWGYDNEPLPRVNAIDAESIVRFLSDDGACLYTGYQRYYAVWGLEPDAEAASLLYRSEDLGAASVVDMWVVTDDAEACSTQIYAEMAGNDGVTYLLDPDLNIIQRDLFTVDADMVAARIGRVEPPLALTMAFDGTLYRWDMQAYEISAQIGLGELAMFGAINRSGSHYVWLQTDYAGLHLVDFAAGTDRLVAPLEPPTYISHLKLTDAADVIIGVDPFDQSRTVSAWLVESGERLELGAFRECERSQPDLAKISHDGSALVIGCDLGIDVWRVVAE